MLSVIETAAFAFPKPGRVRLKGEKLAALRRACFYRDNGKCADCGKQVKLNADDADPLKMDMAHIVSRGAGGSDELVNTKCMCHRCHMKQHNGGK